MSEEAIYVLIGLTGLAGLFLTWNKVWSVILNSISTHVGTEQDARCNTRIVDLTKDLKDAILPMTEDVTLIRGVVEDLKLEHAVLSGDVKAINTKVNAMEGYLGAVDTNSKEALKISNQNSLAIARIQ